LRRILARMQLVDVDIVGAEPAQARITGGLEIIPVDMQQRAEVLAALLINLKAKLGGDHRVVAPAGEGLAQDLFAMACAIGIAGIEERHSEVEPAPDRPDRLCIVHCSPAPRPPSGNLKGTADRPTAKPNRTNFQPTPA